MSILDNADELRRHISAPAPFDIVGKAGFVRTATGPHTISIDGESLVLKNAKGLTTYLVPTASVKDINAPTTDGEFAYIVLHHGKESTVLDMKALSPNIAGGW